MGVIGLAMVVSQELANWVSEVSPERHQYTAHKLLFAIVTLTGIPLVQITMAGVVCWLVGLRRRRALAVAHARIQPHRTGRKQRKRATTARK